jgi:hypothetical protein
MWDPCAPRPCRKPRSRPRPRARPAPQTHPPCTRAQSHPKPQPRARAPPHKGVGLSQQAARRDGRGVHPGRQPRGRRRRPLEAPAHGRAGRDAARQHNGLRDWQRGAAPRARRPAARRGRPRGPGSSGPARGRHSPRAPLAGRARGTASGRAASWPCAPLRRPFPEEGQGPRPARRSRAPPQPPAPHPSRAPLFLARSPTFTRTRAGRAATITSAAASSTSGTGEVAAAAAACGVVGGRAPLLSHPASSAGWQAPGELAAAAPRGPDPNCPLLLPDRLAPARPQARAVRVVPGPQEPQRRRVPAQHVCGARVGAHQHVPLHPELVPQASPAGRPPAARSFVRPRGRRLARWKAARHHRDCAR